MSLGYEICDFTYKFKGPMFISKIDSVNYNDRVVKFYANKCHSKCH